MHARYARQPVTGKRPTEGPTVPGNAPTGRTKLFFVILYSTLATALSGCGYSLHHRLLPAFSDPRGIYVPIFTNNTEEIGAERVFTHVCIRELKSRGLVLFRSPESGAGRLEGTVEQISYAPTGYTTQGFEGLNPFRRLPTELGLNVVIHLRLLRDGKEEWSGRFTGFRRVEVPADRTFDFQAPSSIGLRTQTSLELRYAEIAKDVMRDAYDAMVDVL
jgi:hypothetical protein